MSHRLRSLPKTERWRHKTCIFLTDRPALAVPRSACTAADIVALMASFPEAGEGFAADVETRTPEWSER